MTLSISHAWWIQQNFRQHSHLRNSLLERGKRLKTRSFTLDLGFAGSSKPSKCNNQRPSAHEAEAPRWVLLRRVHCSPYPNVCRPQFSCGLCLVLFLSHTCQFFKGLFEEALPTVTVQKDRLGRHHSCLFKAQITWEKPEVLLARYRAPTKQRVFKGV